MNNNFLIICLFLICTSSVNSVNPIWKKYISPSVHPREVRNCAERGTPGLICTNCMNVAKCVQIAGGNWLTIPVETCVGQQTCNVKEGGCSTKPGPCTNRPREIRCRTQGLVPDAYDCQKYHFCEGPNKDSKQVECKGKFAFNIKTGRCDLDSNSSATCKRMPIICTKAGHAEAWPEDKNLFYVCTKNGPYVAPEFYRCEHGYVYDNKKQDCVKGQGAQEPGKVPEICTELGKYPDPKDEDSYYHCVKIGHKPRHRSCDWGETFDPQKLKCVCDNYWWC